MKNRIFLTIVALVILPTALLSIMAGRAVRNRELVIMAQMKTNAASMTRLCADEVDSSIKTELNSVRESVGSVLMRTASLAELARAAEEIEKNSAIIDKVIVYHDPWQVVYPPSMNRVTTAPDLPSYVTGLRQAIARTPAGAAVYHFKDNGAYYYFTLIPGRKDLYSGLRVDLAGFRQMLDRALAKMSTDDLVLSADGWLYHADEGVIIEDSLSSGPVREPVDAEAGTLKTDPLASRPMLAPFADVTILAYPRDPARLHETGRNQSRLMVWGIVLLLSGILAGVLILVYQIHLEIRRASARANYIVGISHDLRTPIASLKMMTESLYSGNIKDPEKQHNFLGIMAGECDRLNRLVERVLYFVRYGEDALVFYKKTVDVKALIESTVKAFFESASRARAETKYSVNVPDDLPSTEADKNAITQVLLNLLDNALKYATGRESNMANIEVSASAVEAKRSFAAPARHWICISVSDNGPGIPPDEYRKIFKPYFRSKAALNANVSGVGLGLALCRHIIRAHEGWIEPGRSASGGAKFCVYLPYEN